jgi:hypothetical protein
MQLFTFLSITAAFASVAYPIPTPEKHSIGALDTNNTDVASNLQMQATDKNVTPERNLHLAWLLLWQQVTLLLLRSMASHSIHPLLTRGFVAWPVIVPVLQRHQNLIPNYRKDKS